MKMKKNQSLPPNIPPFPSRNKNYRGLYNSEESPFLQQPKERKRKPTYIVLSLSHRQ